jgi:hypothetical protein
LVADGEDEVNDWISRIILALLIAAAYMQTSSIGYLQQHIIELQKQIILLRTERIMK